MRRHQRRVAGPREERRSPRDALPPRQQRAAGGAAAAQRRPPSAAAACGGRSGGCPEASFLHQIQREEGRPRPNNALPSAVAAWGSITGVQREEQRPAGGAFPSPDPAGGRAAAARQRPPLRCSGVGQRREEQRSAEGALPSPDPAGGRAADDL
ncbi:Os05g0139551 [Oryza sativa Japonica Group]|uniref:Os05g0139551 protein n=1 Tax=Oryza sativa subsp. japonica TaxID=39947 RepID=A0A0P0WHX1_ORYSJ|nr:Os05g0139551 [Oryza sativa Japonica Group]